MDNQLIDPEETGENIAGTAERREEGSGIVLYLLYLTPNFAALLSDPLWTIDEIPQRRVVP